MIDEITRNSTIILGYPIQYSNAPYMVRDFINRNKQLWNGKKVLCVATMGLFSGDGAGCTAIWRVFWTKALVLRKDDEIYR